MRLQAGEAHDLFIEIGKPRSAFNKKILDRWKHKIEGGDGMRITRISIGHWRNLRNIDLIIPQDATLICLVGENGSGKSHLLELVAAVAHKLGISQGLDLSRGDPFVDIHELTITAQFGSIAGDFKSSIEGEQRAHVEPWDASVTLTSTNRPQQKAVISLALGGVHPGQSQTLANAFVKYLRRTKETHHIYLDADRAYPKTNVDTSVVGESFARDYTTEQWGKQRAHLPSRTLFEEWSVYMLSQESQSATRHQQRERDAAANGVPRPDFIDQFASYRASVQEVLPHLRFQGVDVSAKQIVFDSTGQKLQFYQLSGGEREIAFIIGQIDRFNLRTGLLLIDEPELHLNPDLIRVWVAYLRDTITEGQAWIATHSLEAVEVAGETATFVLEKNAETRIVESARPWREAPTLSILARALGSPAFSLSTLRFVFIEAEPHSGEKERFFRVCGDPTVNRFIAGSSCTEVVRKFDAACLVATECNEGLAIGAVIDADFRDQRINRRLVAGRNIHVLGCHEVENLFLHPEALADVIHALGQRQDVRQLLLEASDMFAGGWVLQYAYARNEGLSEQWPELKTMFWNTPWNELLNAERNIQRVIADRKLAEGEVRALWNALSASRDVYRALRETDDLWLKCMGKQTLSQIATYLGFTGSEFLESAVIRTWTRPEGAIAMPRQAQDLRSYIGGLAHRG